MLYVRFLIKGLSLMHTAVPHIHSLYNIPAIFLLYNYCQKKKTIACFFVASFFSFSNDNNNSSSSNRLIVVVVAATTIITIYIFCPFLLYQYIIVKSLCHMQSIISNHQSKLAVNIQFFYHLLTSMLL